MDFIIIVSAKVKPIKLNLLIIISKNKYKKYFELLLSIESQVLQKMSLYYPVYNPVTIHCHVRFNLAHFNPMSLKCFH